MSATKTDKQKIADGIASAFPDHAYAQKINEQIADTYKRVRNDIEFEFEGVRYSLRPKDCRRLIQGAWSFHTGISKGVDPKLDDEGERVGAGVYDREYPVIAHDPNARLTKDPHPLAEAGLLVQEATKHGYDSSREITDLGMRVAEFVFDGQVGREVFTFQECIDHHALRVRHDQEAREDLARRRREGWGPITDAKGERVGEQTRTCFSDTDFAWIGDQIADLRRKRETTVERIINRLTRRNA